MRHLKSSGSDSFREFLKSNYDFVIYAFVTALGAFAGSALKINAAPYPVGFDYSSFLSVFIGSFSALALYVFILFFCGSSAIGFISPVVLFVRGMSFGGALSDLYGGGAFMYYICDMPLMVVSSAVMIALVRDNISLSVGIFRMCVYAGSDDLSYKFYSYTVKCMVALVFCAAICFIYALIVLIAHL